MQSPEDNHHRHHRHSDTELVSGDRTSFSGPLNGPLNKRGGGKESALLSVTDDNTTTTASSTDDNVEITLDVGEDSVALDSVEKAGSAAVEDPELAMLAKGLEKKSPLGSSVARNASSRIRQVSQDLKRLDFLTRHTQPAGRLDLTKSAVAQPLQGLKFICKTDGGAAWARVEKRFNELTSTTNELLPRSLFGECIGINKEFAKEFAGELFDALARTRNISCESITKGQLKEFWDQIADQSFDRRLQTFFDMVDKDADGRITEDEVREIISSSASVNKLSNIQKQAGEYARVIMEELDTNNLGYIMIEDLEMLLLQGPNQSVRGGGESRNMREMLIEKLKLWPYQPLKRWYRDFQYFLLYNWRRIWVMALWTGVMAGPFAYKYVQYRNRATFDVMGNCVCMAKGAAETLKLNMVLILLPVCRKTITWLRNNTRLEVAVPFNDNISFHKVIAVAIPIGVGIHGISHLACDIRRLLNASPEKYELAELGDQPTSYWHFVKGWEGVTGILMVVLMAIPFILAYLWLIRKKMNLPKPLSKLTRFSVFWYSHNLFIIVYALLIIHGIKLYLTHEWYEKTTWMYLTIPIMLYAGERLIRAFRSNMKVVKILKVVVYPGNVLALVMSKPRGFKYKSGQYIFVNCAAVSRSEWHPFSITSAPMDDYLSVHISTLGDWGGQLEAIFSEICQLPPTGNSELLRADFLEGENNPKIPRVLIDGSLGVPTQDYKDYDMVLLVGLGLGAIPMISIVKDIVNNIKAMKEEENALEEGGRAEKDPLPSSLMPKRKTGSRSRKHDFRTRRAYFYWMIRELGSFDWLHDVMDEVTEMDHNGVIEMHNYCTSVYDEEGDACSALIDVLQTINHAKNGADIVSGTRVKSHFGAFYSGAPPPVKELKHLAFKFSHKTSTKFEFHTENI